MANNWKNPNLEKELEYRKQKNRKWKIAGVVFTIAIILALILTFSL